MNIRSGFDLSTVKDFSVETQAVACTQCGRPFAPSLKQQDYPDDIQRIYLECPHCSAQFTSYYADKQIRRLQQRQASLRLKIRNSPGTDYEKLNAQFEKNKQITDIKRSQRFNDLS